MKNSLQIEWYGDITWDSESSLCQCALCTEGLRLC